MKCPKSEEFFGIIHRKYAVNKLLNWILRIRGARFAVRGADGPAARSAAFRKKSPFYLNFILKG